MTINTTNTYATERYVSLYGFFSFDYPANWKNEVDEAGNYVFYDEKGGSGVARIITIQNEETHVGADDEYLNKVLVDQREFDSIEVKLGACRCIRFVQLHDIEKVEYTVYYWVTASQDKIILFTYMVQSLMKELPVAELEKHQITQLISSISFMHGEEKKHHHHYH